MMTETKKVFIKTRSGRIYTGIILKEDSNFMTLRDKFDLEIRIAIKDIEVIEEARR